MIITLTCKHLPRLTVRAWKTTRESLYETQVPVNVTKDGIAACQDVLPVIVYLAGYCSFAVFKKLNCRICKELTTCAHDDDTTIPDSHNYIHGRGRGRLMYSCNVTTNIILFSYVVINKLTKQS